MRASAALLVVAMLACTEPAPPPTVAGQAHPEKNDWLRAAQRSLRHEHCSKGAPFRSCSDTTREQCDETITAALRPCVQTLRARLPPRISVADDDERLRMELAGCVWHHAAFTLGPSRLDLRCLLTPN